jgi:hypothetical protein
MTPTLLGPDKGNQGYSSHKIHAVTMSNGTSCQEILLDENQRPSNLFLQ